MSVAVSNGILERDRGAAMKVIPSDAHVYAFAPELVAVQTASIGENVCFEALDALSGQVRTEEDILDGLDFERVNPATGPLAIEGIQVGDSLAVRIDAIDLTSQGAIVTGPGLGALEDGAAEHATRVLQIWDGHVWFGELALPIHPMVGVIGIAPAEGTFPTGTAYRHGGNMDTKEIGPGSTVFLPVAQEGAMLAMGDVHAVMGDGEVCVSACEVAAQIAVTVERVPSRCLGWPVVETADSVCILVSLPTIDEALKEAVREAIALLRRARGLGREDAYMLASLAVDLGISQLVDPNKTAKASIPKMLLPSPWTNAL